MARRSLMLLGTLAGVRPASDRDGMNGLSNVAAADLSSSVGLAVAKASLDQAKQQGSQMVDLIQAASPVAEAPRGAVSQAPSSGETGGNLDVQG